MKEAKISVSKYQFDVKIYLFHGSKSSFQAVYEHETE